MKRSKSRAKALSLAEIKRVLLLSNWIVSGGNRRAAAEALGLGYTNAVESLREYGVPLRQGPTNEDREKILDELAALRGSLNGLIKAVESAAVESDTK